MQKRVKKRGISAIKMSLAGVLFVCGIAGAQAQVQNQWRPVEKQLVDYIAEGFAIETILLEHVTPVSTQATVIYLRKDNALVRCSETVTRRGGSVVSTTVSCAELDKPVTK